MNSLENEARTFRFVRLDKLLLNITVVSDFGRRKLKFLDFLQRVYRNFDPSLRTQEKSVEYVRAVNAAKLDKVPLSPHIWIFNFFAL